MAMSLYFAYNVLFCACNKSYSMYDVCSNQLEAINLHKKILAIQIKSNENFYNDSKIVSRSPNGFFAY